MAYSTRARVRTCALTCALFTCERTCEGGFTQTGVNPTSDQADIVYDTLPTHYPTHYRHTTDTLPTHYPTHYRHTTDLGPI